MSDFVSQKIGMGFAFGAFGFLVFGSLIAGSTFITAMIRGFQAAFLFGSVAWGLGWFLLKDKKEAVDDNSEGAASEE